MYLESRFGISITVLTAVVVAFGLILLRVIHNVFASPIPQSVPGPWPARLTSKWILLVDLSGKRARTVDALHKKYGPVVRLAPNELSFADFDAVKPIYGPATTCIKSPVYDTFGRLGIFQMRGHDEHHQRRRRMAHVFAPGSLQQMEPLIHSVIDQVVAILAQKAGKPVDALHWCRMTALDVAGEVLLGKSFGAFDGDEEAPLFIQHLDNMFLVWGLAGNAPLLHRALSLLPVKKLQRFLKSGDSFYQYGADAVTEYLALHGRVPNRRSLLTKFILGDPDTGTAPLSDTEIGDELANMAFAATDTTGNTMTYALYRLCCHPAWQQKLRDEILASGARDAGFAFQSLQALPVLNSVVMETLRFHPSIPSALPRVTAARETVIAGLVLPQDTLVSMQSYTTQRDPAHFPDAEQWRPSRWLTRNGGGIDAGTAEMREMLLGFGKGSRACLGQHMATMQIKILLARVVARFRVRLASDATHDEMDMTDHFTLIPKGRRCGLVFTEL